MPGARSAPGATGSGPAPACSTWPMTTCWTCSGSTPARSSAAWMAMPPSSVAVEGGQAAAELADGRAGGAEDHGLGHGTDDSLRPMDIRATTDDPPDTGADTIVVGVFEGKGDRRTTSRTATLGALRRVRRGAARSSASWPHAHAAGRRWILVGCGERDEFDAERARVAAAVALGRARELGDADAVLGAAAQGRRRRRRRARRGHAARRLPLHGAQVRARRRPRARARWSSPRTTTSPRAVGARPRRRRGRQPRARPRQRAGQRADARGARRAGARARRRAGRGAWAAAGDRGRRHGRVRRRRAGRGRTSRS